MLDLPKLPDPFDRYSRSNVPVLSKSALHPQGSSLAIEAKVVTMWKSLLDRGQAWGRAQPQLRMFSKTEVVPNETGVGCLDNEYVLRVDMSVPGAAGKTIHAHRTRRNSHGVEPGQVIYAAGQSPPVDSFKDFLAQALSSKQGIFEIVSRKTHYDPNHSSTKSMIDLLKMEIAKPRASNDKLTFGNRYEYHGFNQVAGNGCVNDKKDFLRFELSVIDRDTGGEIAVPLTQVGLKFSDKLLRPAEIRRADSCLTAHQEAVKSCGRADQTGSPAVQLILSRAGSGRNATLISYHKICHLIENRLVTEDTLDVVLEEEIDAQRMRRGPRYVHSVEQLASLRTALLDKIASDARITPLNVTMPLRRASAPAWLGQTIINARDMTSPRANDASQTANRSGNVTALPVQDHGKNAESSTPMTELADQVLSHIAEGRSFDPIATLERNQREQSADVTEDLFFDCAAMQGQSQTKQSEDSAPNEIVEADNSIKLDGALILDDPINHTLRTRYTNDQLEEEIDAQRMRRGPRYVHSVEQLATLRTALLDKMASDARITPPNSTTSSRGSSAPAWLEQTISNARDMISPRANDTSQTADRSSNATALPVQDHGKNAEITTPITDVADQVLAPIAEGRSFDPIDIPERNQREQSADVAEDIFFDCAEVQGHSQTKQSEDSAPSEIVEANRSPKFDGARVQDGPINPPLRTRYTNDQIDMQKADLLLLGPVKGINLQRKLFADDGGSWWRAAFVSVLLEQAVQSPNGLERTEQAAQKIAERIRALGTDFSDEANIVEQMMLQMINPLFHDGCSGKGIRGFMTDLQPRMGGKELFAVSPLFLSGISRLKAVDEDDNDPGRPGETALKKIAHAMLLKAGFSPKTVNKLFDENSKEEGSAVHIVELMNQLGAREGIIFTRPWVQPDLHTSKYPWLDFKSATLDMYAMNNPLGPKGFEDLGIQTGDEVQKFIYPHANKPVIVAEHGHFSILIDTSEANGEGYT